MGIIPLQYLENETAETLGLTGKEGYTIKLPLDIVPGQIVDIQVTRISLVLYVLYLFNYYTSTCITCTLF